MKNILLLLASLSLGFMATSCQNDLEDEINVNEDVAVTRSIGDTQENGENESLIASTDLDISGSSIIVGTNTKTYTVTSSDINLSSYTTDWDYDNTIFSIQGGGDGYTYIKLKLLSSTDTSDTNLTVHLISNSTGLEEYATTTYIGCNGPRLGTSSVRVVRSSDGVEVYPSSIGLRPNTWYYGYLSNTQTSSMTLNWNFNHATVYSQSGLSVYFQTDSNGYSNLTVSGKMSGSTVYKYLTGVTLYGGVGLNGADEEESEEEYSVVESE